MKKKIVIRPIAVAIFNSFQDFATAMLQEEAFSSEKAHMLEKPDLAIKANYVEVQTEPEPRNRVKGYRIVKRVKKC